LVGTQNLIPRSKSELNRTSVRGYAAMQKRLVSKDTSPSAFFARNPSASNL